MIGKTNKGIRYEKICMKCDIVFLVHPYRKDDAMYCSRSCSAKDQKRKALTFKKCEICSKSFRTFPSRVNKKYCSWICSGVSRRGKRPPNFKETGVGYRALHRWVECHLGKPAKCENCLKDELKGHKIHWANKSGDYKRLITDWVRLCAKCHKAYDCKLAVGL